MLFLSLQGYEEVGEMIDYTVTLAIASIMTLGFFIGHMLWDA